MRMFTYIVILLIIASYPVKSQPINNSSNLVGGWLKYPPEDGSDIEGSRNLYDDFRPGAIYYKDNDDEVHIPLRLNLYNDEFEYVKNDTLYTIEDLNRLIKIEFDDQDFIYIMPQLKNTVSGFVVRWNDELPAVITKMRMGYYSKEIGHFGKPKRFERDEDTHYIMNADGQYKQIYSIKKLIKYLGSHQEELSSFAKEENISASDPKELAKLLDYYQTLGQDL